MISGISGVDSSNYLQQLRQVQSSGLSASQLFSKIDTNGDGSISKDEFSTYKSSMAAQFESSILGSQTDSTSSLLALLQSAGLATAGSSASSTATSTSPSSLNGGITAAQLFDKIDTNGDGSISKDEMITFLTNLGTMANSSTTTGNKLTVTA